MYKIIPLAKARLILITTSEILLIIPPSKAPKPIGIEVIIDITTRENVLRLLSLKKIPTARPSGIPCNIRAIVRWRPLIGEVDNKDPSAIPLGILCIPIAMAINGVSIIL